MPSTQKLFNSSVKIKGSISQLCEGAVRMTGVDLGCRFEDSHDSWEGKVGFLIYYIFAYMYFWSPESGSQLSYM